MMDFKTLESEDEDDRHLKGATQLLTKKSSTGEFGKIKAGSR